MGNLELIWERTLERMGEGPYLEYRIPGIVATNRGTLLVCYEGRMSTHDDWARIDTVLCRSEDDGQTWAKTPFVLSEAMGGTGQDTTNNPTLIVDGDHVHLIFHQNYARAFHCVSEDDGQTWSQPEEITQAFREFDRHWNVCATGPGHGIATRSGRLIAPIWIADGAQLDERRIAHQPSWAGAIYSDDHGRTWHAGALAETIADANETTIAELPDGRILYNFRNREPEYYRWLGISSDGAEHIDRVWRCDALPDPRCFASMIRLPDGGIVYAGCASGAANPDLPQARIHMTLMGCDGDPERWKTLVEVDAQGGYPDVAVYQDSLYVLYEIDPVELGCVTKLVLKKYRLQSKPVQG